MKQIIKDEYVIETKDAKYCHPKCSKLDCWLLPIISKDLVWVCNANSKKLINGIDGVERCPECLEKTRGK